MSKISRKIQISKIYNVMYFLCQKYISFGNLCSFLLISPFSSPIVLPDTQGVPGRHYTGASLAKQEHDENCGFQPALYSKSKGCFSGVFKVIMSLKMETFDKKLHYVQRNCLKNVLKRLYQKSKFRHFPEFCLTFQRENRLILSQICKK